MQEYNSLFKSKELENPKNDWYNLCA
jgi:hypothetical protein